MEDLEPIARKYLAAFLAGEIDQLDVAYMSFFPPPAIPRGGNSSAPFRDATGFRKERAGTKTEAPVDYEFVPNAAEILDELLPQSFGTRLFKCFLMPR